MKKFQEAKLNMYSAVLQHGITNESIVKSVTAFNNVFNAVKAKISSIIATSQLEEKVIKGVALDKAENKKAFCSLSADIAAVLFAYATATNNLVLQQEADFSPTDLMRSKDELLIPRCMNIHKAATDNLAVLKDYNLTQATLDALQDAIDSYSVTIPAPRNAVGLRTTARKNLEILFRETDRLLKNQLDKLAVNFKTINPDFLSAYKSNRLIVNAGAISTRLKGRLVNAKDDKVIRDAAIELIGTDLRTTSTSKGNFTFKGIKSGTYAVKITKEGFEDILLQNIEIKTGSNKTIPITMKPK